MKKETKARCLGVCLRKPMDIGAKENGWEHSWEMWGREQKNLNRGNKTKLFTWAATALAHWRESPNEQERNYGTDLVQLPEDLGIHLRGSRNR